MGFEHVERQRSTSKPRARSNTQTLSSFAEGQILGRSRSMSDAQIPGNHEEDSLSDSHGFQSATEVDILKFLGRYVGDIENLQELNSTPLDMEQLEPNTQNEQQAEPEAYQEEVQEQTTSDSNYNKPGFFSLIWNNIKNMGGIPQSLLSALEWLVSPFTKTNNVNSPHKNLYLGNKDRINAKLEAQRSRIISNKIEDYVQAGLNISVYGDLNFNYDDVKDLIDYSGRNKHINATEKYKTNVELDMDEFKNLASEIDIISTMIRELSGDMRANPKLGKSDKYKSKLKRLEQRKDALVLQYGTHLENSESYEFNNSCVSVLGKGKIRGLGIKRITPLLKMHAFKNHDSEEVTQMFDDLSSGGEYEDRHHIYPFEKEYYAREALKQERGLRKLKQIYFEQLKYIANTFGKYLFQLHQIDLIERSELDYRTELHLAQDVTQLTEKAPWLFDDNNIEDKQFKALAEYVNLIHMGWSTGFSNVVQSIYNSNESVRNSLASITDDFSMQIYNGYYDKAVKAARDVEASGVELKGFTSKEMREYIEGLKIRGMYDDAGIGKKLDTQLSETMSIKPKKSIWQRFKEWLFGKSNSEERDEILHDVYFGNEEMIDKKNSDDMAGNPLFSMIAQSVSFMDPEAGSNNAIRKKEILQQFIEEGKATDYSCHTDFGARLQAKYRNDENASKKLPQQMFVDGYFQYDSCDCFERALISIPKAHAFRTKSNAEVEEMFDDMLLGGDNDPGIKERRKRGAYKYKELMFEQLKYLAKTYGNYFTDLHVSDLLSRSNLEFKVDIITLYAVGLLVGSEDGFFDDSTEDKQYKALVNWVSPGSVPGNINNDGGLDWLVFQTVKNDLMDDVSTDLVGNLEYSAEDIRQKASLPGYKNASLSVNTDTPPLRYSDIHEAAKAVIDSGVEFNKGFSPEQKIRYARNLKARGLGDDYGISDRLMEEARAERNN